MFWHPCYRCWWWLVNLETPTLLNIPYMNSINGTFRCTQNLLYELQISHLNYLLLHIKYVGGHNVRNCWLKYTKPSGKLRCIINIKFLHIIQLYDYTANGILKLWKLHKFQGTTYSVTWTSIWWFLIVSIITVRFVYVHFSMVQRFSYHLSSPNDITLNHQKYTKRFGR